MGVREADKLRDTSGCIGSKTGRQGGFSKRAFSKRAMSPPPHSLPTLSVLTRVWICVEVAVVK